MKKNILEFRLLINKELFNERMIDYEKFKEIQDKLLKEIGE